MDEGAVCMIAAYCIWLYLFLNPVKEKEKKLVDNEVYQAIYGKRIGKYVIGMGYNHTEGQPCSVQFEHEKVIEREKSKKDVIGFYHTHPNMSNNYSFIDRTTMEGWTDMFGKTLYCLIEGNNGLIAWKAHTDYNIDAGYEKAYIFRMEPRKAWKVGRLFIVED